MLDSNFYDRRMRFFRKAKKTDGWLTLAPLADGFAAAYVKRHAGARPSVELCAFFPGQHDSESLDRIGKELRAAQYRCSTVLGSREYQLLSLDAPNVPPDELRTAIRWRLKDMLDFHVDDATIDVLAIPVEPNAPARANQMFAVAARNSVIQQKQALFGDARIDVTVIDIPEMAQRNISTLVETEGRGLAMLSFGDEGGLLTVTYRGELYLSRRIDVPMAQLLDTDFERRAATFDRITLELQRSLDHFDRQYHYISLSALVLAPTAATGLAEYLSSNLYVPVEELDLSSVLELSAAPQLAERAAQQRFFIPLGAALRHEELTL